MTLLLIDSEVFTRFHLHLNPIVWQLVINPAKMRWRATGS